MKPAGIKMAYRYCENCNADMSAPTDREVLGYYGCPACGAANDSLKSTGDIILNILDRLDSIESKYG